MALFDFLNTGDPQKDAAINQGLLYAGLSLLGAKGRTMPALSQAGLLGLQGADQYRQRALHEKRAGLQDQLIQSQLAEQKRQIEQQQAREAAYKGSYTGTPEIQGNNPSAYVPPTAGTFDMQKLLQGLAQAGAPEALSVAQALGPQKPTISKAGDVARDAQGRVVWQNPADADKDPEDIRALKVIYAGDPAGYKAALARLGQKKTSHQPGVNVSYGAPVAGVDASGSPIFFQPPKDGGAPRIVPGVKPPPVQTPASIREKIAENSVALTKLNQAVTLVEQQGGSLGAQNYAGDAIMQRLDPKGVDVRAAIADIGSQKIHDRSGAAVTISEAPRLKPFIPQATDTPDAAKKKLVRLRDEVKAVNQALASGASITQATEQRSGAVLKFDAQGNPVK